MGGRRQRRLNVALSVEAENFIEQEATELAQKLTRQSQIIAFDAKADRVQRRDVTRAKQILESLNDLTKAGKEIAKVVGGLLVGVVGAWVSEYLKGTSIPLNDFVVILILTIIAGSLLFFGYYRI